MENLTGGTPPVRPLPCVVPCKLYFIEQYKTTGYDDGGFAILRERTDNPRTLLFLDIAEQVYHHYQSVLKQRN